MQISDLKIRSSKNRKRVGRGNGSKGTYCGRGMNGQKSRSGGNIKPGFEGGQTPLIRKMPKLRGFKNINTINYEVVNLGTINKYFDDNTKINKKALFEKGLISKLKAPVKILGSGKLEKKYEIQCESISKSALEKLEKGKGKFIAPVKEESKKEKKVETNKDEKAEEPKAEKKSEEKSEAKK